MRGRRGRGVWSHVYEVSQSAECTEGSSGRERYVVAVASGRVPASGYMVTSWPDVSPLLHPCWVCVPRTQQPKKPIWKEGDRLGVGVVVGHVDELLIRCFVIVDGEDLSFGAGGDCVDAFWKTGCFAAESTRVNGLLEEEGELSRE